MDKELFSAIASENYSLAKELGLNGARADQLEDGITALHLLAGHEDQEASEVLEVCLRTADPNVRSSEGMSPVHVAALWGRLDNLKLLINHGGDLNQTDDEGQNVLDFASLSEGTSAKQCIKFILEVESNISLDESKTCIPEEKWDGMKHEQPVGEVSCGFSESFYTAIAEDSLLDQTVVTFPNLHPWFSANVSSGDLDETVVDKITELSISSNSLVDGDETVEEGAKQWLEHTSYQEHDNEDPAEFYFGNSTIFYDWKECSTILDQSIINESITVPENLFKLSNNDLRMELQKYGEIPGPIMTSTRNVYIKRLARLQSGSMDSKESLYSEYLPELRRHLEGKAETPDLFEEEESMCIEFTCKKVWREGTEKSSFNYLLIDPRVTQNLPTRSKSMSPEDVFRVFILAIFYVGKGKRSRPYAHLNEAMNSAKQNPKIQQIRDIWAAGLGVVSLHIFQSVIPVEAYTREACMIDALGLPRLTNKKRGDYYGRAASWPQKKKREMGVFLLQRALKILLSEGERQLRPEDLKVKHNS